MLTSGGFDGEHRPWAPNSQPSRALSIIPQNLDVVSAEYDNSKVDIYLNNTTHLYTLPRLDLTAQASALSAMSTIDNARMAAENELGSIGAFQIVSPPQSVTSPKQ